MKIKIIIVLLILVGLGTGVVLWKQNNKTLVLPVNQTTEATTQDMGAIRTFTTNPNMELSFVNTSLPQPYFMVGKVTKLANGENIEKVDGWVRQINVYHQKELLNKQCSVYEYHVDPRNHSLVAVVISMLKPSEVEDYKKSGVTCTAASSTNRMPKITKAEAETIAMDYLARGVKNFDQIKDQFVYTEQYGGESHQWLWQDKSYKLPEGLEGRPYSYPTIRISVYGDKSIQYWNTLSLFEN